MCYVLGIPALDQDATSVFIVAQGIGVEKGALTGLISVGNDNRVVILFSYEGGGYSIYRIQGPFPES